MAEKVLVSLIGDVIQSRAQPDRRELQRALVEVLEFANGMFRPVQPLAPTVGDEFQGGFSSLGAAARASLVIRLKLLTHPGSPDSRYGLGWGHVEVFDDERAPISQDGPGWWAAREGIEKAKWLAKSSRTAFARTGFGGSPDEDSGGVPIEPAVDAFLLCRDAIVDRMSTRPRRLLCGLLVGQQQSELAAGEGITQGAVSQSLHRTGAYAVEAAHEALDQVLR